MSLWSKAAKACNLIDQGGARLLFKEAGAWVRSLGEEPATAPHPKSPQVLNYRYIANDTKNGSNPTPRFSRAWRHDRLVINWLIPPIGIGSGGHLNIFRMIQNLEALGHENRLYIVGGDPVAHAPDVMRRMILDHFLPIQAPVYFGTEAVADSDVLFATSWQTAYPACRIDNTLRKCYFVQDFEPFFYPMGAEWHFAEATYRFGFYHLTAGPWLTELLRRDYGAEADFFPLSFERDLYYPRPVARANDKFRVFYYARPVTPRRCFELGVLGLNEFYRRHSDRVEIVAAGWDIEQFELPFPCEGLGVMALDALPELYSSVDVALVNSSTNCSLLPMEVAACRTAVVDLAVPNVAGTLVHGENAYLAEPTPHGIAAALEHLYQHPEERLALAERAYRYAHSQPRWEDGAKIVERALHLQLEGLAVRR